MRILAILHAMAARSFYTWAMREIDPMHPDLPQVRMRQLHYQDRTRKLFGDFAR